MDKDYWRTRVRGMKQPRVTVGIGTHMEEGEMLSFTVINKQLMVDNTKV